MGLKPNKDLGPEKLPPPVNILKLLDYTLYKICELYLNFKNKYYV